MTCGSHHKGPVTQKMFRFEDVIMRPSNFRYSLGSVVFLEPNKSPIVMKITALALWFNAANLKNMSI